MKCSSCGSKMMKRGGQYVCMNQDCPEYLLGKKVESSSLADVLGGMKRPEE